MKECPVCLRCFPDHVNHCPSDGDLLRFYITGDTVLDGRYQLEKRLGQGGMGAVFKARHIFLKTQHAIKIILPDLVGNDPSLVTRFRQEAMAAAAIRHPNIIAVTDFGVVNGTTPFLVMEFIEGRSLHDLLTEEKHLSAERALEVMSGVGAGLGAAHRQGIVHRDLKPLNIMLRNDAASVSESIRVLDFGLAKIKSGDVLGSFVAVQTTGLMGSPFYMAPEQWSDEEPDRRADIYSLGVILYQMLAGEVPFRGGSIPSIMTKHLTTPPPSLLGRGTGVTPAVEAVVRHALEKEPDNRPQTVEDFVTELREAVVGSAAVVSPDSSAVAGASTIHIAPTVPLQPTTEATSGNATGVAGVVERGAATNYETPRDDSASYHQATGGVRDYRATVREHAATEGSSTTRIDEADLRASETGRHVASETAYQPTPEDISGNVATPIAQETTSLKDASPHLEEATRHAQEATPHVAATGDGATSATSARQHDAASDAGNQSMLADEETHVRLRETHRRDEAPDETRRQTAAQHVETDAATAGSGAGRSGRRPSFVVDVPGGEAHVDADERTAKKSGARVVLIAAALVLLVGAIGGLGYYFWMQRQQSSTAQNTNTGGNSNAVTGGDATREPTRPDLVQLTGGAFLIGRNDVPPFTTEHTAAYLQHMYAQWPAHTVNIAPFAIDRTEVTNAEYAEFVKATGYPPPPDWDRKLSPPEGRERWPVRNVSYEDAQRFAAWRSQRDRVAYRLPTEEEWEYAARGGDATRLYPWGAKWIDGRANLDSQTLQPVGSHPEGATPQGVQDMIGNVWEWTSTEATHYKGNTRLRLTSKEESKMVVRGGGHASKADGDEPVSATSRRFAVKEEIDPLIGFRLVRVGS